MSEGRRHVSKTTLQEMKTINDEIAALKLELKSKVDVIDNLKADMELIKLAKEVLVSVNKSLEAKLLSSEEFKVSAIESLCS